MSNNFLAIRQAIVEKIANEKSQEVFGAVRAAYIQHFHGQAINPPSHFLTFPDKPVSRIIALPAAIMHQPRIAGIKWISSNPDNIKHGLKRASAVIILNDYETGFPVACMEGAVISALRTVNSAILAASLVMKNKKIGRLGIVGTGNISKTFLHCLSLQNYSFEQLTIFDLEEKYAQNFLAENKLPNAKIAKNPEELIQNSDLILFATTAAKPYIQDISLFQHRPVVLNLSLRDLAPEILINSNNIVDDIEHVLKANTSPHLTFQRYKNSDFINATIGQMLVEKVELDKAKPTIISPMGMGILDLAVANFIYHEAAKTGLAIEIENFFN